MRRIVTVLLLTLPLTAGAGFSDLLKQGSDLLGTGNPSRSASSGLSDSRIAAGLKEALSVGAERAIDYLGRPGGFLNDPKVRIPLPDSLKPVADGLRAAGQGALVDEVEQTMNRAAEAAIPQTLEIVKRTVSNMTLDDARRILDGGDDAATRYLRQKAGPALAEAIRPIVSRTTDQVGATAAYKRLTGSAGGMVSSLFGSSLDLDDYVTEKTLDGLFTMLAEEEKKIRTDPVARSTELLKKVFGR
jgi:hypothetical protein